MLSEVRQEVMFAFLQLRVAQHIKKKLELQVVLLMDDEVRDDVEMQMEEQKMRSELCVLEMMER